MSIPSLRAASITLRALRDLDFLLIYGQRHHRDAGAWCFVCGHEALFSAGMS